MTVKTYSMTKKVGNLTEFEERKYLTWGDFLNEIKDDIQNIKLSKVEKQYLSEMLNKGNSIQQILNNSSNKYAEYELYIKDMLNYFCIQDDLIKDIKSYVKQLIEWKEDK